MPEARSTGRCPKHRHVLANCIPSGPKAKIPSVPWRCGLRPRARGSALLPLLGHLHHLLPLARLASLALSLIIMQYMSMMRIFIYKSANSYRSSHMSNRCSDNFFSQLRDDIFVTTLRHQACGKPAQKEQYGAKWEYIVCVLIPGHILVEA